MMAFLTSKLTGYAVAGLAAVLLTWWAYSHVYNSGYDAAATIKNAEIAELKAAAVTARDIEIERQDVSNSQAKAREAASIAEMQAEADTLENTIKELQREASEDSDAGRVVLGAPSVQRINKVR